MLMDEGLGVVHLFARTSPEVDATAVGDAIDAARANGAQVVTAAILGHKADLCVMALSPDWRVLRSLQSALQAAGLEIHDSYVSITEVSEYAKGMPAEMLRPRLYPELPPADLETFCFYPMSKKRDGSVNWYATPYERRHEMMMEHGTSGRKFAGRIVQLITGSTGLDDYEWGVTLFAKNPEVVKEVVYTMRFDTASALFGDFGEFYVGYLADVGELLAVTPTR